MMRLTTLFKHRLFYFCAILLAVVALLWLGLRESSPKYRWDAATIEPFKQWYQINWHNQAVGRASVELLDKGDHYAVIEDDFLEGRVQGRRFQFRYIRELYFSKKAPYQLTGGRLYSEEPQLTVESSFINDGKIKISESRNDETYQKELPPVAYTLSDYFLVPHHIEKAKEQNSLPVEAFEVKTLNAQKFKAETSKYQVLKTKPNQN